MSSVASLIVVVVQVLLVPLAYASPPDPSWIAGIYDNADYDDVIGLVTDAVGVCGDRAPELVPLEMARCALPPEPTAVPDQALPALFCRGPPPIDVCDLAGSPRLNHSHLAECAPLEDALPPLPSPTRHATRQTAPRPADPLPRALQACLRSG